MPDDVARWRLPESVVHAALARPVEERAAFLAEAWSGDSDLRREAISLLERDARADAFLTTPLDVKGLTAAGNIEETEKRRRTEKTVPFCGRAVRRASRSDAR